MPKLTERLKKLEKLMGTGPKEPPPPEVKVVYLCPDGTVDDSYVVVCDGSGRWPKERIRPSSVMGDSDAAMEFRQPPDNDCSPLTAAEAALQRIAWLRSVRQASCFGADDHYASSPA
jgi:hypothetical protein